MMAIDLNPIGGYRDSRGNPAPCMNTKRVVGVLTQLKTTGVRFDEFSR